MKVKDVPQDLKYYKGTLARDVCYAVDEQGQYTSVVSDGWEVKDDALEMALEDKSAWKSDGTTERGSEGVKERRSEETRVTSIEHRMAAHCENGATSALLRHHGIDLSEPMIFGLASGLWFSHVPFVKMGGIPVTSFRTFPGVLFKRTTSMLGIKTKTCRYLLKSRAMKELDRLLLQEHKPVGCIVGMYDLPYAPPEYRFRFNGHNICIIGKDETSNMYDVLDSNMIQQVSISGEDLMKVRFATGGTYPLMGQMYWIESVPEQLPDLRPLIIKSIQKTCWEMTSQPFFVPWLGTRGIRLMAKRIRRWEKVMGHQKAILNLAQVIRMLEEIGTGGAGFRFLYGAFLQESAAITGITELNDYAMRITEIGDLWRTFAFRGSRIIKQRKGEHYTFDDLGNLLEDIAQREHAFFTDLTIFITHHQ